MNFSKKIYRNFLLSKCLQDFFLYKFSPTFFIKLTYLKPSLRNFHNNFSVKNCLYNCLTFFYTKFPHSFFYKNSRHNFSIKKNLLFIRQFFSPYTFPCKYLFQISPTVIWFPRNNVRQSRCMSYKQLNTPTNLNTHTYTHTSTNRNTAISLMLYRNCYTWPHISNTHTHSTHKYIWNIWMFEYTYVVYLPTELSSLFYKCFTFETQTCAYIPSFHC